MATQNTGGKKMKISQIIKGDIIYSKILGKCKVIGKRKNGATLEQIDFGNIKVNLTFTSKAIEEDNINNFQKEPYL